MTETTVGSGALGAEGLRAEVLRDFAASALFERTFQDGMVLVEDTAAYLDGEGRQESRMLAKSAALTYAGESMRLTTQLMQVASWLLVQRAVREGDMAPVEACQARYRIDADPRRADDPEAQAGAELPFGLMNLRERAERLYERVRHLDQRMYCGAWTEVADHPVFAQHERLRAAFKAA